MTTPPNTQDNGPLDNPTGLFAERLAALRQLAPELFAGSRDGVPTVAAIQAFLGEDESAAKGEVFEFSWVGKAEAKRGAGLTPTGTLVPQADGVAESQNLIIEGDNLEVLRILRKSYAGQIKLIYIDPPYNTGNDFVYPDNYAEPVAEYLRRSGKVDGDGRQLTANTRADGRFHSKWLTMMYPRLVLARELLREDGVIFISIDDNEVHNLRAIMNEIFGEENFVASVVWQKKFSPQNDATYMSDMHDYIIVFAKNTKQKRTDEHGLTLNLLPRTSAQDNLYTNRDNDKRGPWQSDNLTVKSYSAKYDYPITTPSGREVHPSKGTCWRVSRERLDELVADNRIWFGEDGGNVPRLKRFLSEVQDGVVPTTWWPYETVGHNQEAKQELKKLFPETDDIFDTPKPVRLLKRILELSMRTDKSAIAMDFFAGSGTLAHAVMELNAQDDGNRAFILVQEGFAREATERDARITFPTIAAFTRERVRRAATKLQAAHPMFDGDFGFQSFTLAPAHIRPLPRRTYGDADMQAAMTDMFAGRLHDGWTVDGLASELLLSEGFPLTSTYTVVAGWRMYTAAEVGYPLYINLDHTIASVAEFLTYLAQRGRVGVNKRHGVAIFQDSAMTTANRVNVAEYVTIKTV